MSLGVLRPRALAATLVAVASMTVPPPSAQSLGDRATPGTFSTHDAWGDIGGGIVGNLEAPGDLALTSSPRMVRDPGARPLAARPPYTFFPQAGVPGQDLFTTNYVDLNVASYDITQPGLDYDCTAYAYQGHSGHDSVIEGFREQAIGVPVFAALDGTVIDAHDGEPDQQTVNLANRPANYVTLSHTGGYRTQYFHLKRGSVAATVGQTVTAGTQLGLTGSSGNSSWPHLHFTSIFNGVVYEPNAGACRPGATYWTSQNAQAGIRRDVFATSFTFGTADFSGSAGLPYDEVTRRGWYAQGTTTIYFRVGLRNVPALAPYRIAIRRSDGTTAQDTSNAFTSTSLGKHVWYWFARNVTLNTTGTWTLDLYINGQNVVTAPFSVVTGAITNRAPLPVSAVSFVPATPGSADVPTCVVTPATLYRRDPDYDVVRYRYRWFVRGSLVRDVTTAALADAIPSGLIGARDELRCEVTPSDGALTAPTATVSVGANVGQLAGGQSISSANGFYRLTYQTDGNLVIVDTRTRTPIWASSTVGRPGVLVMQGDGNLVLYDADGIPRWASGTSGNPGAFFELSDDGRLLISNVNGQRIWST